MLSTKLWKRIKSGSHHGSYVTRWRSLVWRSASTQPLNGSRAWRRENLPTRILDAARRRAAQKIPGTNRFQDVHSNRQRRVFWLVVLLRKWTVTTTGSVCSNCLRATKEAKQSSHSIRRCWPVAASLTCLAFSKNAMSLLKRPEIKAEGEESCSYRWWRCSYLYELPCWPCSSNHSHIRCWFDGFERTCPSNRLRDADSSRRWYPAVMCIPPASGKRTLTVSGLSKVNAATWSETEIRTWLSSSMAVSKTSLKVKSTCCFSKSSYLRPTAWNERSRAHWKASCGANQRRQAWRYRL